jgi:hypothetical protein
MLFPENLRVSDQAANRGQESGADPAVGNTKPPAAKEKSMGLAEPIETESQALNDLSAVPIYFASSYALVKPYVSGFDSNVLDAPSLKTVRINTAWKQPETAGGGAMK